MRFTAFAKVLMRRRRLRQMDLAQRLRVSQPFISAVLSGKTKPPLAAMAAWGAALKASAAERQALIDLAVIAWAPDASRRRLEAMYAAHTGGHMDETSHTRLTE